MPLFSVIIPAHNRRAFLPATLASVFSQTHTGAEIIVVDGGSSDGTADYVTSLGGQVRLLRQDHLGPGAARNAGAALASAEYLAFLDSDDLWLPWTLATFAGCIARYDRPAFICGKFIQFSTAPELDRYRDESASTDAFADYLSSWPRHPIVGAGMVAVRRDEFLKVGGFTSDPVNLEDHDLSLKLGTARGFVQILAPVTLAWRRHPDGVSNDLRKSVAGCLMLIATETAGKYPGGAARAWTRREMIASHARSVSLQCLKGGNGRDAFRVYLAILRWHLSIGRWKYLLAFPFYALLASVRRR